MPSQVDIEGIQQALVDLIQANVSDLPAGFDLRHIYYEATEYEMGNIAHMPLVNVRLVSSTEELTSIPDGYYEKIQFGIDVFAKDFTSFRESAKLRTDAIRALKLMLKQNPRFHASLQTSMVDVNTIYGQASVQNTDNKSVAFGSFNLVCEAYND